MVIETERLLLRELTLNDSEAFYSLNQDPEVIQYTGDRAFTDVNEACQFLSSYASYDLYGFGRWAVINKKNEKFLGWCGLKYSSDTKEYDVGFRFFKIYWGRGFATESAIASIDAGFKKFNLKTIIGRAMIQNQASIRVLQKTGMTFHQNGICGGRAGVIYKIENTG